jgi:hypothetical protein
MGREYNYDINIASDADEVSLEPIRIPVQMFAVY